MRRAIALLTSATPATPATLAALLATSACATTYLPQHNGRIAVVMEGGAYALYKDGKVYKPGLFGGDVDEAVAGNPRAEDEMSTYTGQQTTGSLLTIGGAALVLGGAAVLAADPPQGGDSRGLTPSLAMFLGGLVADLVGLVFTTMAQPHLWNAVNIYNDGVGQPPPPALYPPPR
jgi:hypothetical protein